MKKYVVFLMVPLIFACQGKNEQIRQLQEKNDSLKAVAEKKEGMVNDFVNSFNQIEENLQAIKEKEQIVRKSSTEGTLTTDTKERINEDIMAIYELLLENKKKLRNLRERYENSQYKMDEFQQMIDRLTAQLEAKNKEIDRLKSQLAELKIDVKNLNTKIDKLNYNVDSLSSENKQKESIIREKTAAMNRAYFAIGSEDELEENGVIEKEGGFLGLGKMPTLKEDYNKAYFTEIDMRDKKQFELAARKAEVVTPHPKTAYKLNETDKQINSLEVTDAGKFWSATRYLVIVVKK